MPCYKPIQGWYGRDLTKNGKRKIVFREKDALGDGIAPVTVPCGKCVGCRVDRSREWATRCVHEASLYKDNCFITLTFAPQYLPRDMSLNVREFQLFMKRLRKKFGSGIRFYHCGEYGEQYGRPHYHALLFNFDFPDKYYFMTKNGYRYYRSDALEEIWPYGHSTIGDVTFQSAAYVARYVMKKQFGDDAEEYYKYVDPITGEVFDRKPEYTTMSRRPGIGKGWYDLNFDTDCLPKDSVNVVGAGIQRVPKYYDRLFEHEYPEDFELIKQKRKAKAKKYSHDNTRERLRVKEACKLEKLSRLVREVE